VTEAKVVVKAAVGLHARPAATFVQAAMKHKCQVTIDFNGKQADGKSVLKVLALGVKANQEVTIRASGEGEAEAVAALVTLVASLA